MLLCSRATTNGCGPSGVVVTVSARPRRKSGVPIPGLIVSGVVVAGSVPAGVTGGPAAHARPLCCNRFLSMNRTS